MRKKLLSSCKQIIIFSLLLVIHQGYAAQCGTTVNWHNLSDTPGCSATSSGVLNSVVDKNIDIQGTNALVEGIHVEARTCDILITVTSGDAVITGSGNRCDLVPTHSARLYLYAAVGRTITFQISDHLAFYGSSIANKTPLDLLVTVTGGGNVIFNIDGGLGVSFTQTNTFTGATQFYVGMGDAPNDPFVQFMHSAAVPTMPFIVNVGPNSIMSYIANEFDSTAFGTIDFAPGTNGLSSMGGVLNIANTGAVIIGGHAVLTSLNDPNLMIDDIDLSVPAGAPAIFEIDNSAVTPGRSGSLQIVNGNNNCTDLLIDPFCQHNDRNPFSGMQAGFILVGPSVLNVANNTYLEYVGTATNTCCVFNLPDDCGNPQQFQRLRNGSAFIVDAPDNNTPATINLLGTSAIYFLSGVDSCGNVSDGFIVDPLLITPCAGNIVLDVEGPLNIVGTSSHTNVVNILSLVVEPTGCPVTEESPLNIFPKRTFDVDLNGEYLRYNSGAFLVNNRLNISNASLTHNDENHAVYEENNLNNPYLNSEPTYVGGDSYLFFCNVGMPRPTIAFYNSAFRIQTSVAATGVDWLIPNLVGGNNISAFVFYNNGRCIDDNYGRNMILGTDICFENCITTTDMSSHLNIFQEVADPNPGIIDLYILTATNSDCTTQGITGDISNQFAVQTIFLNNETNISIGTNGATGVDVNGNSFALTVTAALLVDSVYISFESYGGDLAYPPSSATTGQGGIFVDALGQFQVLNNRIANMGAMVAMSRNGFVNLPYNSVFFDPEIGIAQWNLDLTDPTQQIIIPAGQTLSDYTLDWGATIKAYCCDTTNLTPGCFVPYEIEEVPAPCAAPFLIPQNLNALPTVQGTIDQLQILRARIGDPVNLLVDGGLVRELVLIQGFNSAQAPTALVVVQNNGTVGLGTTHKDLDALQGSVVLGVNGVTLVPNGNGTIQLNEDIIINNVCHILSGTAFGVSSQNILSISSTTPKELRIKAPGVLDLSQFTTADQVLNITGQVRLVCEPGARIILGGGILQFSDQAEFYIEPTVAPVVGTTINSTDSVRVVMSGSGTVLMTQGSSMLVGTGAYFGVETYPTCGLTTNISFQLKDEATIEIGNPSLPGGVFQVGDTTYDPTRSVSFQLFIDGPGATFNIDRQGFFGLGVGIVDKPNSTANDWLVSCVSNILTASILVEEGTFIHNKILNGSDADASLFAIGNQGQYTFQFNPNTSDILGGGNMVQISCTPVGQTREAGVEAQAMPVVNAELSEQNVPTDQTDVDASLTKAMHFLVLDDAEFAQINSGSNLPNNPGVFNFIQEQICATAPALCQTLQGVIPTTINPIVTIFAGATPPYLVSGMMAGKYLLTDPSKGAQPGGVTGLGLFDYLKTDNYAGPSLLGVAPRNKRANFAPEALNIAIAGFVSDGTLINRIPFQQGLLLGRENNPTEPTHSFNIGAVNIIIDPDTDSLALPREIIGSGVY